MRVLCLIPTARLSLWLIILSGIPTKMSTAEDTVQPTKTAAIGAPGRGSSIASGTGENIEMVMTPSWPLEFAAGETVSVDCGVYTKGKHGDYSIQWLDGKLEQIQTANRINVTNNFDTSGAYSVLTLTVASLVSSDGQTYTCQVETNVTGEVINGSTPIHLTVLGQDKRCGFEGEDLCGWKNQPNSNLTWRRHHGMDTAILDRSRGPRYDHTYGPSKHIGHFLDVDLEEQNHPETLSKALLVSPNYPASSQPMCLHFWYVMDGTDQDKLVLSISQDGAENWTEHLQITQPSGQHWVHQTVDIPQQNNSFWLRFEAHTCTEKCDKAAVALDDIALEMTYCESTAIHWPNVDLKLRLMDGGPSTKPGDQPIQGRVEVLHDGQYGSICSRQFGNNEAKVVCRSLGFEDVEHAVKTRNSTFGKAPTNLPIWLTKLQCGGEEKDLSLCIAKSETWGNTADCTHEEDAGVKCVQQPNVLPPTAGQSTPKVLSTTPKSQSNDTPQKSTPLSTTESSTVPPVPSSTTLKSNSTTPAAPAEVNTKSTPSTTVKSTSTKPSSTVSSTTSTTGTKSTPVPSTSTASSTSKSTPTGSEVTSSSAQPVVIDAGDEDVSSAAGRIGRGVVAGIVLIVLLAISVLVVLVYKGRKRRLRKSKYLNFGSASYSREHLPTNEFHLESPLTMSSMGYTVLA